MFIFKKESWPWPICAADPQPSVWRWIVGCHWRSSPPAWPGCSTGSWCAWMSGLDWCPLPPTSPLNQTTNTERERDTDLTEGRTKLSLERTGVNSEKGQHCSIAINSWWHFSAANLRQGGRHGRFPSHAVADEDALLDAQLGKEVFQIIRHRFIGQHWAVRAVAMVTGIYSQHLTGQGTVRTLGMGGKRQLSGNLFLMSDSTNKGCIVHMRWRVPSGTPKSRLSISIYYKQAAEESYQMTGRTLVDCTIPCLLLNEVSKSVCWEQTPTHKDELLAMWQQTGVMSSSLHYLSARALHQGLRYWVEVWFAAKEAMKKHQGSALSLPIEDIIGQAEWAGERQKKTD